MSPLYEFEDVETREEVSVVLPMAEAVPLGHTRIIGGRVLRRLVVAPRATAVPDRHFTSMQLEPWIKNAPRYNEHGEAQFNSQREIDEFVSKHNAENPHETIEYNQL